MAPINGMLERLYKSGNFADVSIGTETKTLQVHKTVLCAQSPFFAVAFTGEFKEAEARHVDLEESEDTVDNLLHHMYELAAPLLGRELTAAAQRTVFETPVETIEDRVRKLLYLQAAADKYSVTGLEALCANAINRWVGERMPAISLARLGTLLWHHEVASNQEARDNIAKYTAGKMQAVLNDESAWAVLHSNMQYCKEVFKHTLSREEFKLQIAAYARTQAP
ncbi:hypothetical protein LTR85_009965 [Meristemomyces frigidus]|nr:hypothetical protein LTR85_009965 [Meristemomyces frigidus]